VTPIQLVLTLGTWGQSHRWTLFWAMGTLFVLAAVAGVLGRRRRGATTTHGSARWATVKEVRQAGLHARHGVVIGRLAGRLLLDDGERHILLCAPTGAGKGTGVIIPTLLTWNESALILDPKDGENADVTAPWRRQYGRRVALFTPCRSPQTRLNVRDLIRLGTDKEFGDALLIAQSLTAAEKHARESATALHFRELAALLLTAGLLHVCYTVSRSSLAALWSFFTQQHRTLAACLKAMAGTAHTSHGVHQAIASMTTAIQNITGDRELSSVWTTAIRPLVLYSDPLVAASTDTSTIRLEDLQYGPEPLSLYLIAPSPMELERLHPLYRVILDVAMARLMEHPVRTWQHRLLVCADELPQWGYTRAIEKGVAVMRGYGIKGLLVTQDLPQLEEVYGPHSAIWGNTDLKIFHAPTNDLTAKRISENMMGRGTMEHPVEQRQAGLLGRRSVAFQHVARPLLTTDEVMELDAQKEIMRLAGVKPILCDKVNYLVDAEFRARRRNAA
jgi:type IV secretion system protein VirD4